MADTPRRYPIGPSPAPALNHLAPTRPTHVPKTAAYGFGNLLATNVFLYAAALTPATIAGAWVGRRIVGRISERVFVLLVEAGLLVAGTLFLLGF